MENRSQPGIRQKLATYYGWRVVLAAMGVGVLNGGVFIYGLTVFVDPMVSEMNWTYLQFSVAVAIGSILLTVLSPFVGAFSDRFGPRRMLLFAAAVGGAGLFWLSRVDSLAEFYAAFVVLSIGGSACGSVVLTTSAVRWFSRRLSLAMGLTTAGVGLGGPFVYLLAWLVGSYGWRTALVIAAIGVWVLMPLLTMIIRWPTNRETEQPAYLEENPAHGAKPAADVAVSGVLDRPTKVLRSRLFWFLAIGLTLNFIGINGVVVHVVPYLTRSGLTIEGAALTATFVPLLSIPGRLFYGWIGDRLPKGKCLAVSFLAQTVGLVALQYSPSPWALGVFVLAFGTGYGGMIALMPAAVGSYFGRNIFGRVQSWFVSATSIGAMAGPLLAGWAADTAAGYALAWWIFVGFNLLAVATMLLLKPRS
jgi:MFS family permease